MMHLAERALLRDALWLEDVSPGRLREHLCRRLDWGFLLSSMSRTRVTPTVAHGLARAELLELVPPDAAAALRDALAHNAMQNEVLLLDLARVAGACEEAGVDCMALKGSALLAAHYRSPSARHLDDIDLLVRAREVPRARMVLDRLGCKRVSRPIDHEGAPLEAGNARTHGAGVFVTSLGTPIDLHWRAPGDDASRVDALFSRGVRADVKGARVLIPCVEDLEVELSVHVLIHHAGAPSFLARHLVDLQALEALGLPAVRGEARRRWAVTTARALLRASRDRASDAAAWLLFPPPVMHAASNAAVLARSAVGQGQRGPSALVRAIVPSRTYMVQTFGAAPDSAALAAAYVLRPLRLAHRRLLERRA